MHFRDSYHIGPEHIKAVQSKFKVIAQDGTNGVPDRLLVKVPGTHGGFVNKNGFFYKVDGMKIGFLTWTNPYQKPVVVNHEDSSDPIGRVVKAQFIEDNAMDYVNRFGRTTNIPKCHTDLYLNVVDKTAIEKILNGTYLTVSTAGDCEDVRCSICDHDIARDGFCEHARNKIYDSKLAYWKFGPINYKEVSIVNNPADEFAVIEATEPKDSVEITKFCVTPLPYELSFGVEIVDVKDSAEEEMDKEKNPNLEGIEFTAEDLEMIKAVYEEIEKFINDGMSEDELAEDKKLTTEQRKKMPASTFCGPDRSFPVPDCLHYRVAKTYLGRYKGAGDKTKIAACIERKGKALGCGKYKKGDLAPTGDLFILDELLKDTVPVQTHDEVKQKLDAAEKAQTDLTAQHATEVKALNDQVTALTESSTTKMKEVETEKKNLLVQTVEDMRILLGDEKDVLVAEDPKKAYEDATKTLLERSMESLNDALADLKNRIFPRTLGTVDDPEAKQIKDGVDAEDKRKIDINNTHDVLNFVIFKRRRTS